MQNAQYLADLEACAVAGLELHDALFSLERVDREDPEIVRAAITRLDKAKYAAASKLLLVRDRLPKPGDN